MIGNISKIFLTVVVLTGFQQDRCNAQNCKEIEMKEKAYVVGKDGEESGGCTKWIVPESSDDATLIKLHGDEEGVRVNLTHVGAVLPKYIQCVIYHSKTCKVAPRDCKGGFVDVIVDKDTTLTASARTTGSLEISYVRLTCADSAKQTNSSPSAGLVIWIMTALAGAVFFVVFVILIAKLLQKVRQSSNAKKWSPVDSDLEEGHANEAFTRVETNRKQSEPAAPSPDRKVTAFSFPAPPPGSNDESDDAMSTKEEDSSGSDHGDRATKRKLKFTYHYADIDDVVKRKDEMVKSEPDKPDSSSSEDESEDEKEESEKGEEEPDSGKTEDQDSESSSSSSSSEEEADGESDTNDEDKGEEFPNPPPIPEKVGLEHDDDKEQKSDEESSSSSSESE